MRAAWAGIGDPSFITRDPEGQFATRAFREVAEALDGSPGETETVKGHYSAARLPGGAQAVAQSAWVDPNLNVIRIEGIFTAPGADALGAGTWERELRRQPDGSLLAVHANMHLQPGYRDHQIGPAFNDHLDDYYRSIGVRQIALHANSSAGGYTWAREGYRFDSDARYRDPNATTDYSGTGDIPERLADLHAELVSGHHPVVGEVDGETYERLLDQITTMQGALDAGFARPIDVANLGRDVTWTDDDSEHLMWLGKDVLLGSSWAGIRDVPPAPPTRFTDPVEVQSMKGLTDVEKQKIIATGEKHGLTARKASNRYERLFAEAEAAGRVESLRGWYGDAQETLIADADRTGLDRMAVIWATAAMSPGNKWPANKDMILTTTAMLREDRPLDWSDSRRKEMADEIMIAWGDAAIEGKTTSEQAIARYLQETGGKRYEVTAQRPSEITDAMVLRAAVVDYKVARDGAKWGVTSWMFLDTGMGLLLGGDPDGGPAPIGGVPHPNRGELRLLNGPKVRSFANNIAFPTTDTGDVTVDVHMGNAGARSIEDAHADPPRLMLAKDLSSMNSTPTIRGVSLGVKPMLADIIRRNARKHGMLPQEYQAIVWQMWIEHAPPEAKRASTTAQGGSKDHQRYREQRAANAAKRAAEEANQ